MKVRDLTKKAINKLPGITWPIVLVGLILVIMGGGVYAIKSKAKQSKPVAVSNRPGNPSTTNAGTVAKPNSETVANASSQQSPSNLNSAKPACVSSSIVENTEYRKMSDEHNKKLASWKDKLKNNQIDIKSFNDSVVKEMIEFDRKTREIAAKLPKSQNHKC